ncbi:MAG: hypothetical protein QXD03_01605 [Candidatus Anstonellales archaeon]
MPYELIQKNFQESYKNRSEDYRKRLVEWRDQPAIQRIEKPSNPARARSLGYKAKQGVFVVRVRIAKGNRVRRNPKAGRKSGKYFRYISPGLSLQKIAEQRANRKHTNAEVIGSYWVGEDGKYKYFEVILVDRAINDKYLRKIASRRGRAYRLR